MEATSPPSQATSHDQRNLAALSYVWILSVPVFLARREDGFVGPHARQGLLLFTFSVVAWFIPYAGYVLEIILGTVMVMGYVRASQGRTFILPLATEDIERLASRLGLEWGSLWNGAPPMANEAAGGAKEASERENQRAACAYLSIASVLVADTAGDSRTVSFHARQGVTIFLLSVIAAALGTFGTYVQIALLVSSVAGFLSALSGRSVRLPVIHGISVRLPTLDAAWRTIRGKMGVPLLETGTNGPLAGKRDRTLALLSYFFLSPIFLLSANASPFVTFHARQGFLLNAGLIGLYALGPGAYSGLAVVLAMTVLGASRSHRGQWSQLPVIAEAVEAIRKITALVRKHVRTSPISRQSQPGTDPESLHHD